MRSALLLVAGAGILIGAAKLPAPLLGESDIPRPLPSRVYNVAALGRSSAAADAVWLRTIQLIGQDRFERAHYPGLEDWVSVILELDPRFQTPASFAGVLLVTEADRAEAVDRFLAIAESNAGSSYYFAMLRGFVAYFGRLDLDAAAGHYDRAVARGGPPYLKAFAKRLRAQSLTCGDLANDLVEVSISDDLDKDALRKSSRDILVHCVEQDIRRAATTFRLKMNRSATSIDELVEAGMKAPPTPPRGQCWTFKNDVGKLEPCGEGQ